jgi:hypothetical protein
VQNGLYVQSPPPPPRYIGIKTLGEVSRQSLERNELRGKVFNNNDLRDPFAALRISAAGSRFAHAR